MRRESLELLTTTSVDVCSYRTFGVSLVVVYCRSDIELFTVIDRIIKTSHKTYTLKLNAGYSYLVCGLLRPQIFPSRLVLSRPLRLPHLCQREYSYSPSLYIVHTMIRLICCVIRFLGQEEHLSRRTEYSRQLCEPLVKGLKPYTIKTPSSQG